MKFRFILLLAILAWITCCNPVSKGEYYSLQGFTQGINIRIIHGQAPIILAEHGSHLRYAEELNRESQPPRAA